jgi:hypothetical protein
MSSLYGLAIMSAYGGGQKFRTLVTARSSLPSSLYEPSKPTGYYCTAMLNPTDCEFC